MRARHGSISRFWRGWATTRASIGATPIWPRRRCRRQSAIGAEQTLLSEFVEHGKLPAKDDPRMPRAVNDDQPALAVVFDFGKVGAEPVESRM